VAGRVLERIANAASETYPNRIGVAAEAIPIYVTYSRDFFGCASYSYYTEAGKLLKQLLRYPGKRFCQRRPASGGGWIWDVQGVKSVLYNLVRVRYASTICLCEGEKDCDSVNKLNLKDVNGHEVVATTSGGVESWQPTFAEDLRDKRVAILPDQDEPGQRYATQVAECLSQRGIAWRIVSFEESGVKDVSEFLEKGHTADDLAQCIGTDWIRCGDIEVRRESLQRIQFSMEIGRTVTLEHIKNQGR